MQMQSLSRVPIKVLIPRGSIVLLRNVVLATDRSQSGVKSRFKVVFYRNNTISKPRNVVLIGLKEVFVAPPRVGSSFALHFRFRPFTIRIERLHFSPYETPLRRIEFKISKIDSKYKIPNGPIFNRFSLDLTGPKIFNSLIEIKRKSSYFEREAPKLKLDLSRESIFEPTPLNARLLKDYESNRKLLKDYESNRIF